MSPDDWKDKERLIMQRIEELRRMLKRTIKPHIACHLTRRARKLQNELSRHRRKYPQEEEPECD